MTAYVKPKLPGVEAQSVPTPWCCSAETFMYVCLLRRVRQKVFVPAEHSSS